MIAVILFLSISTAISDAFSLPVRMTVQYHDISPPATYFISSLVLVPLAVFDNKFKTERAMLFFAAILLFIIGFLI